MLLFTRCADATSLVQRSNTNNYVNETRICQVQGGGHALCPHDTHVEQKPTEMMSHSSRSAISHLLPEIQRGPREDPNSTHATTEDPAIAQGISIKNEPVAGDGEPFPKGFVPALF